MEGEDVEETRAARMEEWEGKDPGSVRVLLANSGGKGGLLSSLSSWELEG